MSQLSGFYPIVILTVVQGLCIEVEQESEEGFDEVLRKFRTIVSLDPWYSNIIGRIRREIPGELNSLR